MIFPSDAKLYAHEVVREAGEDVLYVNYLGATFVPSIADSADVMSKTVDLLIESPTVSRVVFVQQRNYCYDFKQIAMLIEAAQLYVHLIRQEKVLEPKTLARARCQKYLPQRLDTMRYLILSLLKSDPVSCYVEAKRLLREEKITSKKMPATELPCETPYIRLLEKVAKMLESLSLIKKIKDKLKTYKVGSREIYAELFRPEIVPNFTFTRLMALYPPGSEMVDQYEIGPEHDRSTVTLLKVPDKVKYMYHLMAPEFVLSEQLQSLVNLARNVLLEHKPKAEEFVDPARIRLVFFNIARDLLRELGETRKIKLNYGQINSLATILVRHTIGFGLVEILLQDDKLQDIMVNAPIGIVPIFVRHQDFDECNTNIMPSHEDADSWAAKFRMISGRPLDEANPVLDTELIIGTARARVAIIQQPLSPYGLAYALRRHREKPWTLPLYINNRMINSLTAGVLSFIIDGSRTLLIAGTRSSGKTSMLSACMLEIMPKYRMIVCEGTLELPVDSLRNLGYDILRMKVREALTRETTELSAAEGIRTSLRLGDSALIVGEVRSSIKGSEEVFIVENGLTKRVPIKDIENKDVAKIRVPTLGFDMKMKLSPLKKFVKHPKRKKLIEVITKTGRKVIVTPDHSLFTSTKDFKVAPIKCEKLKKGSTIIIPASMPYSYNNINFLNVMEIVSDSRLDGAEEYVRKAIKKLGWKKATKICKIKCGDIYNYFRRNQKTRIPITLFKELMKEAKINYDIKKLKIKHVTSNAIPAKIPVNEDFCRFLGYLVTEGYYGKNHITITNSNEKIIKDVILISKRLFGIAPKLRRVKGKGESTQIKIVSAPLVKLISKLGSGRISSEKRVPALIYGLSKEKITAFLKALYSGDGSFTASKSSGNCIRYFSISKKLAEDVAYLLLTYKILARIFLQKRQKSIGKKDCWIVEFKQRDYVKTFLEKIGFIQKKPKMIIKGWSHSKDNFVRFTKNNLLQHLKYPRKYRHLKRFESCSKHYLKKVVNDKECKVSQRLKDFANGDFYLDQVKEINEMDLPQPEFVYDLSVNPSENFVGGFGGILLHNTEALAMYEAMRVGALANVVAGTIHGASPYGVFDRVVNDLKVPATSFKATDIVAIVNPIKSPDGLHRWRRMLELTEVRKHWLTDPSTEHGFVDLLRYDAKKDELLPTEDLITGESEVLKDIAGGVRGWAGNWDAVWDNVKLRANIKQATVDTAKKINMPELLEAAWTVKCNNAFHNISEKVRMEIGIPRGKEVFKEWQAWLKAELKKITK